MSGLLPGRMVGSWVLPLRQEPGRDLLPRGPLRSPPPGLDLPMGRRTTGPQRWAWGLQLSGGANPRRRPPAASAAPFQPRGAEVQASRALRVGAGEGTVLGRLRAPEGHRGAGTGQRWLLRWEAGGQAGDGAALSLRGQTGCSPAAWVPVWGRSWPLGTAHPTLPLSRSRRRRPPARRGDVSIRRAQVGGRGAGALPAPGDWGRLSEPPPSPLISRGGGRSDRPRGAGGLDPGGQPPGRR